MQFLRSLFWRARCGVPLHPTDVVGAIRIFKTGETVWGPDDIDSKVSMVNGSKPAGCCCSDLLPMWSGLDLITVIKLCSVCV